MHFPSGSTPSRSKQTFVTSDGRTIAFNQYGDPRGRPVLILHGSPGGRIQAEFYHKIAAELSVRLIAPDRYGYGFTDANEAGGASAFGKDIAGLLQSLNIDEISVIGISGGASFALAFAHDFPQLVGRILLLGGFIHSSNDTLRHLGWGERWLISLAKTVPFMAERILKPVLLLDPSGRTFSSFRARQLPPDQALLNDRVVLELYYGRGRDDYLRQGIRHVLNDILSIHAPFPLDLSAISMPVELIYGAQDKVAPVAMGLALEKGLPNARLTVLEGVGHLSICLNLGAFREFLVTP